MSLSTELMKMYYAQQSHSARSYVQSGLIHIWDGVENTGYGIHDSASIIWKDLKGNRDFALNTSIDGRSSFTENSFYMANVDAQSNNYWAAYSSGGTLTTYMTLEICFSSTDIAHFDVFNVGSRRRGIYIGAYRRKGYLQGGTQETKKSIELSDTERLKQPFSFSVLYTGTGSTLVPSKMYYNGAEAQLSDVAYTNYVQNNSYISLGGRYNVRDYGASGHIYSLRMYNRALTASEIMRNHTIDKTRFNIGD